MIAAAPGGCLTLLQYKQAMRLAWPRDIMGTFWSITVAGLEQMGAPK